MKANKMIAIAAVCLLFAKATTYAQADLTISPVSLLFGDANVGLDFQVKENFSIGATAGYSRGDIFGLVDSRETVPVNLIGKYYFSPKHGADGFYVDAFARYVRRNVVATYKDDAETKLDFTRQQAGLGFGLGYKVVSQKGFVFDIGTGIGRAVFTDDDVNISEEDYDVPSLIKTMGFFRMGLGYRFGGGERG